MTVLVRASLLVLSLCLIVGTSSGEEPEGGAAKQDVIRLPQPPLPALLPPTVPGPSPAQAHLLTGSLPALQPGDGSSIVSIPPVTFAAYAPVPQDVYDWVVSNGKPYYVYVLAVHDGQRWQREGEVGFEALKWKLADPGADGYESLRVRAALIGAERQAARYLEPLAVIKRRRRGVTEQAAAQFERWYLRRSVENLFVETLRLCGVRRRFQDDRANTKGLLHAARGMAEVGVTGKEDRAGWHKVVALLEQARLGFTNETPARLRIDVLDLLAGALLATQQEERRLTIVGELARAMPGRPHYWAMLARIHLDGLRLPEVALQYAEHAHGIDPKSAALVRGDALSALGRHAEAAAAYGVVHRTRKGRVSRGEAHLRAGLLAKAKTDAEVALIQEPDDARATLLLGCVAYARGDLDRAREAFESVVARSSADARPLQAMASYDLGLTCLRLGQGDAAEQAFSACARALAHGARPESAALDPVSPNLGRALVALGRGAHREASRALREIPDDGPRAPALRLARAAIFHQRGEVGAAWRDLCRCLERAPHGAYALGLAAELLADQAVHAHRIGASTGEVRTLADEALLQSGRAIALAQPSTPFGDLLRKRDASMRAVAVRRTPEQPGADRSIGPPPDGEARRLLHLARELGAEHAVLSGVYARVLVTRYTGLARNDALVAHRVQQAQRILANHGRDPAFEQALPPMPGK